MAAKNTLKITERHPVPDKTLLHSLQANHDLHSQLNKTLNRKNLGQTIKNTQNIPKPVKARQEDEVMMQEVAALDDFVVVESKEKSRNLVENIKLRRRTKHT